MRKIEIVPVAEVALPDEDVETGGLVPPPACTFKEPTLDLRAARIDEVRAMMRRGMEYAEAVTLHAGYFGGESRMVVAADRSRYDQLWERLTRGHEFVAKLDDLETAVGGAVAREATPLLARPPVNGRRPSLEPKTPRAKALEKLGYVRKITGSRKHMQVVDDLPVLLAQAAALNQHFQGLVAARVGRGEHRVGAIKSRARAIEKLYRSYGGDASRLVDLVRTICKFDTLDDMISFVESLRDSPLVVVGSKNSLTTAFDSKESAGYRNINLSVIVVDAFTFSHGLEAHVSELQLGLQSIEALRDEAGHAHYIEWRDIKAE
ncbi:hypothetical protein SO694_00016025 [Aureococcus anophagefferens]|uniref:Uncharacterized protein n=2 Tax=Aureococcus anophagefferens TaxID=44056 RepID=A0ABR1G2Z3_AURAN